MDVNKVVLIGKVIKIYPLRYWESGEPTMALTLVTEERNSSVYHRVVLDGKWVEAVQINLDLQQEVMVEGKLHYWQGERGHMVDIKVKNSYDFTYGAKAKPRSDANTGEEHSDSSAVPPPGGPRSDARSSTSRRH